MPSLLCCRVKEGSSFVDTDHTCTDQQAVGSDPHMLHWLAPLLATISLPTQMYRCLACSVSALLRGGTPCAASLQGLYGGMPACLACTQIADVTAAASEAGSLPAVASSARHVDKQASITPSSPSTSVYLARTFCVKGHPMTGACASFSSHAARWLFQGQNRPRRVCWPKTHIASPAMALPLASGETCCSDAQIRT